MKTAVVSFLHFPSAPIVGRVSKDWISLGDSDHADRSVILSSRTQIDPYKVVGSSEWLPPTIEDLREVLEELKQEGCTVDLYLFGDGDVEVNDLWGRRVEPRLLGNLSHVRLVWRTTTRSSVGNLSWVEAGVSHVVGVRELDFHPTRVLKFQDAWGSGLPFQESLAECRRPECRTSSELYTPVDAADRLSEWGGDLLGAARVLEPGSEADSYFLRCWGLHTLGRSGRTLMKESSELISISVA